MGASLECCKKNSMLLGTFVMQMTPRREGLNVGEVDAEASMIGSPSEKTLR